MQAVIRSVRPLFLESCLAVLVRHLIAVIVAEIAIHAHLVALGVGDHRVAVHFLRLFPSNAEDAVGAFLEVSIA